MSSGPRQSEQTVVRILEAEAMDRGEKTCFVEQETADASNGRAMVVPGKGVCAVTKHSDGSSDAVPDGGLSSEVLFAKDVKITVWLRVYWKGTCSNSFVVELPGGRKATVTDSTDNAWHWQRVIKNLPVKAGKHSIRLIAREFDTKADQMLITNDDTYIPQGIETDSPATNKNSSGLRFP